MRVAIAGGSIAGLATACRLTELGCAVTVLERRPDLLEGGRAILLQPNGLAALERLGALRGVLDRGAVISRVTFYRGERALARMDYGELRHPHPFAVEIRPQELRRALAERLAELDGAAPQLGSEAVGLRRHAGAVIGVRHTDADGQEHDLEAELIVGADGPGSTVREELGIGCRQLAEPERYVLGTVSVDSGQDELAVHCGRGYADGVVPLPDGTYFWDRVTNETRELVDARDLPGWQRAFATRVRPGDALAGAVASWNDLTIVRVRPFWAAGRLTQGAVLVGDAAGAVHPHAAQGANLALEDAVALGDALASAGGAAAVTHERLECYARPRHRKLRRYVLWSLLAARTFDAPSAVWRPARRVSFAWNRVGPVRRQLLRQAAGLGPRP